MEAGLMKKVRSVNRSWTLDSYFRIRKPIHRGGVREKMSKGNVRIPQQGGAYFLFCPRCNRPDYTPDRIIIGYIMAWANLYPGVYYGLGQCIPAHAIIYPGL